MRDPGETNLIRGDNFFGSAALRVRNACSEISSGLWHYGLDATQNPPGAEVLQKLQSSITRLDERILARHAVSGEERLAIATARVKSAVAEVAAAVADLDGTPPESEVLTALEAEITNLENVIATLPTE